MKNFLISIKITIAFCVILFIGYVLVLWGVAKIATPNSGNAKVLKLNNKIVGVENIGQKFTSKKYFWSRPSYIDYNGESSGGSNKGTTNPKYLKDVSLRIDSFLISHPYLDRKEVTAEMVTSSGSGLDPHISIQSANIQIKRISQARGVKQEDIKKIVDSLIETPIIGVPVINVLKLNIALDEKYKVNNQQ